MNAVDIRIDPGDIMRIDAEGQRSVIHFDDSKLYYSQCTFWPGWGMGYTGTILGGWEPIDQIYLDDLKSVAAYYLVTAKKRGPSARCQPGNKCLSRSANKNKMTALHKVHNAWRGLFVIITI